VDDEDWSFFDVSAAVDFEDDAFSTETGLSVDKRITKAGPRLDSDDSVAVLPLLRRRF
jgi:hypothetical protein